MQLRARALLGYGDLVPHGSLLLRAGRVRPSPAVTRPDRNPILDHEPDRVVTGNPLHEEE